MKMRILGPLEVERDGHQVALGPKQQTLLAILLVNRGTAVSADRIVEDLYAGRAPDNALKTLQVHVSRLRKALGDGKLETTPAGYRLASELGYLDVKQFEELADAGRLKLTNGDTESAAMLLAEALGLWRGPALADFAYAEFAQAEIARLEERRVAAIEDRIDADLALARHRRARGAREGSPAARTAPGAAHARPLPLGTTG
jgi:DNA-binding SARP family transcriptional activator